MASEPAPGPAPPARRERLEPAGTTVAERLIAAEVRKARGPLPPTSAPAPSPLLARAAAFLPALAAANDELAAAVAAAPPGTYDVEAVDEGAGPHVEMEVACGVLDLKDEAAVRAAEAALAVGGGGLGVEGEGGGGISSSSSSESEGETSESEGEGDEPPRPRSRKRRAAGIEEVG